MSKKLLTRELIVSLAFEMIDENGRDNFSVRQLAGKLGVQASSLYNYIINEYDLLLEVAKLAASTYTEYVAESVKGLPLDDATYKAGFAFRNFLKEHKYLYELLLDPRWSNDPEFEKAIEDFVLPIYAILGQYGVTDKTSMEHLYVAMRVVTHGFSTLDAQGAFDNLSINPDESYRLMMESVINAMKDKSNNKS